ncbi:MAG: pyrrolysine--tRNA(Pyl) ligase large subunit [Firmicutes bacterium HGW-Firmicutes-11]|nr:MAG: pyrrolysine--tRNA(Pyl) ligase large subunit [Firmicutes bacterium HGW-Firmicutes-11]
MNGTFLTQTQKQRLAELGAPESGIAAAFSDTASRDLFFKETEATLIAASKRRLEQLMSVDHRPILIEVEDRMSRWLREEMGFTQVATPVILSDVQLTKMSIGDDHPLREQIFRIDKTKCLRPMLAPNLYELMQSLYKVTKKQVKLFEIGVCFRKESQGAQHLNEFTMLNLVEFPSVPEGQQRERLTEIAKGAMKAAGLESYELEVTDSAVYGETVDIIVGEMELASGAYGPHPLDINFGIFDTSWVGLGIGLERVALALRGETGIKRVGRSITYLDGIRLNF